MLSVGQLIWISCRPLIRLVICVGFGFGITKADLFPQVAALGAGQIILNTTLPCLMFSKIVPAFTTQNIGALGPLLLVGTLYQVLGIVMAWGIKQFFWVPHRFRYGIIVAGGWSNWGDIPTAIVMSITGSAPFGGVQDQNLAVAYVAVFILVCVVSLFPMGGERMVAWDYVGPDLENEEVREAIRLKRHAIFTGKVFKAIPIRRLAFRSRVDAPDDPEVLSESPAKEDDVLTEKVDIQPNNGLPSVAAAYPAAPERHVSFFTEDHTATGAHPHGIELISSRYTSPAPTVTHVDHDSDSHTHHQPHSGRSSPTHKHIGPVDAINPQPSTLPPRLPASPKLQRTLSRARMFSRRLLSPASLSIVVSLVVALVTPLKALFVPVAGYTKIAPGPDGLPPLSVIMDTAQFMGAASVPLGLVTLGSALARLKVPRHQWRTLPLGAISSLAVLKIIVTPVLGVLICQGLTTVGVIDRTDRVLRFVCIFFSCLPTATTQVFLTQVYSGTGDAEHLAAFLIPQYILMFMSMTALIAYTLNLLF